MNSNYGKIKLKVGSYMKKKNITAYKLAKETGLDYKTIQNYRDDSISRIDLDVLARICNVLDVKEISEVLEYKK